MEIKHKVWLEKDGEIIIGMGRESLLKAIKETGSILKASERVGINYRKALFYIEAMEKRTGQKIVITFRGGKEKGGAKLTEFGEGLLKDFESISKEYEKLKEKLERKLQEKKYIKMITKKEEEADVK